MPKMLRPTSKQPLQPGDRARRTITCSLALAVAATLMAAPAQAFIDPVFRTPPPRECPEGTRPAPNPALGCIPNVIVPVPPPPDCPQGWRPVQPPVNPALGCLPGEIAPLPQLPGERERECREGWVPAPNPALGCIPNVMVPVPPPPDCPQGWRPAPNPALGCLPGSGSGGSSR